MGHGHQYQFWTEFFACTFGGFSRSIDGGATWQTPISIPNLPNGERLDVASNGNLFIGGGDQWQHLLVYPLEQRAVSGRQTPTFEQVTTGQHGRQLLVGGNVNPGGLIGQIFLAVDRSGGPTNNNIYMLAVCGRQATPTAQT